MQSRSNEGNIFTLEISLLPQKTKTFKTVLKLIKPLRAKVENMVSSK